MGGKVLTKGLMAVGILVGVILVLGIARFHSLGRESRKLAPPPRQPEERGLAQCPDKPNCVSSLEDPADATHYVAPLRYRGAVWDVKLEIAGYLSGQERVSLVTHLDHYLRAEFTSALFGFVDDLELYFPPEEPGILHVRSASRVGHSDLGVNRRRVETLRAWLNQRQGETR